MLEGDNDGSPLELPSDVYSESQQVSLNDLGPCQPCGNPNRVLSAWFQSGPASAVMGNGG